MNNLLAFLQPEILTVDDANARMKSSTYAQDKVDDAIVEIMADIHEATYQRKGSVDVKHEVFARIIGEPIEILVRRAEVIVNLEELGFKCETTEQNIEDGTLNISWN